MGFMLYQLALNPDIQEKVVAELQEVLSKNRGEFTLEAIAELKYMGQVFNETLRMYPVVDTVRRSARIDYRIPGTNVIIKKGHIVIIPVNVIHNDARYYPNPEVFDPERFSPSNKANRPSCAYIPFGEGLRKCIGYRFATVQSKLCLAKLLSNYKVEPSKNTPKHFKLTPARIVQYPEGGLPLNWIRRQ